MRVKCFVIDQYINILSHLVSDHFSVYCVSLKEFSLSQIFTKLFYKVQKSSVNLYNVKGSDPVFIRWGSFQITEEVSHSIRVVSTILQ